MDSGQDLHQGRFSRAVLTDEGDDFAACNFQFDRLERLDTGKRLRDSIDLQNGGQSNSPDFAAEERRFESTEAPPDRPYPRQRKSDGRHRSKNPASSRQ